VCVYFFFVACVVHLQKIILWMAPSFLPHHKIHTTPSENQKMSTVTTTAEMHALVFGNLQQVLDETLLDAFWSDFGPAQYLTREDVRCAWSNLPLADKLEFVHDMFPTPLDLLATALKRTNNWSDTWRQAQGV
jgi:hypothetical protein